MTQSGNRRSRSHDPLRRSFVVGPGEGAPYPAYLRTPVRPHGLGYVRPFFTRRTVGRILAETAAEWQRVRDESDAPEESGIPPELIGASWRGRTLVFATEPGMKAKELRPMPSGLYRLLTTSHWWEIRPRWPGRIRSADHLIRLLGTPTANNFPLLNAVSATVPTHVLIDAVPASPAELRDIVVSLLSERREPGASKAIADTLVDASREVRAASAHAFEHQGAGDWASEILAAARVERDQEVLELQVRALATVELPDQASVVEWLSDLGQRPSTKPNVQRAINYALDLLEGGRARGDDAEAETYRPGMMIGLTHGRRQQPSRS